MVCRKGQFWDQFYSIYTLMIFTPASIEQNLMYAIDTNIFISRKNINQVYTKAQKEPHSIGNWTSASKLSLNIDKTKYILFGPNKARSRSNHFLLLHYNNLVIERVETTSFLGVLLHKSLSWKSHMLTLF